VPTSHAAPAAAAAADDDDNDGGVADAHGDCVQRRDGAFI